MPDSPAPSPDSPDRRNSRGVSVLDAARLLGTTPDSVRAKLRRRSLEGYRDNDGRWRVLLPDGMGGGRDSRPTEHTPSADATATVATVADSHAELIAELRARIQSLERRLDEAQAERRLQQEAHEAEVDRLLTVVEQLSAERRAPERRPWPGLRRWWRRFVEGESG